MKGLLDFSTMFFSCKRLPSRHGFPDFMFRWSEQQKQQDGQTAKGESYGNNNCSFRKKMFHVGCSVRQLRVLLTQSTMALVVSAVQKSVSKRWQE
jgi:hypothetical protein